MSLTASDLARLGPAAQKQVVEKVLAQKAGKYHNRKTVRHGITFDSKHEADRYAIRVQGQYLRPIQCRRDNRRYCGVIIPIFECFSKQRCYDGHSEV